MVILTGGTWCVLKWAEVEPRKLTAKESVCGLRPVERSEGAASFSNRPLNCSSLWRLFDAASVHPAVERTVDRGAQLIGLRLRRLSLPPHVRSARQAVSFVVHVSRRQSLSAFRERHASCGDQRDAT